MEFCSLAGFLLLTIITAEGSHLTPLPSPKLRIVGGKPALPGQIPYQISIQKKGIFWGKSHVCGGSIISPRCIITAAHCIARRNPSDIIIQAGTIHLFDEDTENSTNTVLDLSSAAVEKFLPYPDYIGDQEIRHDIGIIKLKPDKSINMSSTVQPIAIMNFKSQIPVNSSCTISGWGFTDEYGSVSKTLLVANIPTRNSSECFALYDGKYKIFESMICAGYPKGGINSCYGDSGGPLVCNGKLAGVTSFGIGCAREKYPGVYTQVSYYQKWIQSHNCFDTESSQIHENYANTDSEPEESVFGGILTLVSKSLNKLKPFQ